MFNTNKYFIFASILIFLAISCNTDMAICPAEVEVPGVFSPNNDGKDDVLNANITGAKTWKATFYNRWGEVMDSTENTENLWDGYTSSGKAEVGIYIYRIEGVDYCNDSFEMAKNVVLIR